MATGTPRALPPLGLYVHLPWCERKCPYCDFNSHELKDLPHRQYVEALLRDLEQDLPLAQGRDIESVFIGGGTPSLFSPSAIDSLLQGIANLVSLAPGLEITMEANPGSAEADRFRAFREAGVTRLSLGIQSFQDQQLRALGRIHDSAQARRAIEFAQRADFDSFNIDLMHGLPGQSPEDANADLRAALDYRPPHLSWYQLTIEANTVFYKKPPLLPVEDELAEIQARGENLLAAAGYPQYEVSAYSREGFQCRHNENYWTFGDYLGIGAGAHGKISSADGVIERYAKTRRPEDYLAAPLQDLTARRLALSAEEIPGEFTMNALRLNRGFTLGEYEARTGLPASSLEPQLESLCRRELLTRRGDRVRTTDLGRRFLDSVITEFLPAD